MRNELADTFSRQIEETLSFKEWKQWTVLLFVMMGVLVAAFVFESAHPQALENLAERLLYAVLFALAGFSLHANYRDAKRIDLEIRLASRDAKRLVECNDIGLFLDQTQPRPGQAESTSYFRSHIEALYKIYFVSSQISQDNLIEILHSRLLAKNKRIELQAGVLVTLGLIGTIIGLLMMMGKLSVVVQAEGFGSTGNTIKELMGETGPLKGLAVAFMTTLIAAGFGGVVLKILTGIVEEGTTKYIALISELTEVYVLPMLRSHAAHMERSGEHHR